MKNQFNYLKKLNILLFSVVVISFSSLSVRADVALYKIKDSDTTIYLMGTIHLLPKGTNWGTPKIKAAFDSADSLIVEISQSKMQPAAMQQLVMQYGFLKGNKTLADELSPATYAKIKAMFGANPAAWAQVNKMQPWLVGLQIAMGQYVAQGFDPNSGVDKVLEKMAMDKGKKVISLETADYQMRALSVLGKEAKSGMLDELLADLPAINKTILALKDAWMKGDMNGLAKLMNDDMAKYPQAQEALLFTRNKNWVVKIDQFMAEPGTKFMAVGAGHLAGDKSVIDLLNKAGIKVERVQ